jgi:hypothetical protein
MRSGRLPDKAAGAPWLSCDRNSRIFAGGKSSRWLRVPTQMGGAPANPMITPLVFALFLLAACHRALAMSRRPDTSSILAVAIVSVAMQHYLPGM